jgi:hypothetical protein
MIKWEFYTFSHSKAVRHQGKAPRTADLVQIANFVGRNE